MLDKYTLEYAETVTGIPKEQLIQTAKMIHEEAKPDWWIIQQIANRLGANWNYQHPSEIMDEIASLSPIFEGVSYERLEGWNSLVWPVHKDGTDEPLLYTKRFNFPDGKARLSLVEFVPPVEYPEDFDLIVNNGRLLEHFHEGNLTNKSKGIRYKVPDVFVEVSPQLARERGVKDGSLVRLVSPYGAIKLRVVVTDRVQGKELYVPMHSASHENAINVLTGNAVDVRTQTPAYKQTKVAKIAVGQLLRPPVTNAINNVMAAAEAISQLDPQMTKKLLSSLAKGLQQAETQAASGSKVGLLDLLKALKDPDINRAISFALNLLKGIGEGLTEQK